MCILILPDVQLYLSADTICMREAIRPARETISQLKEMYEGRSVEFVLGDLPESQADPVLLRQVFVNLIIAQRQGF